MNVNHAINLNLSAPAVPPRLKMAQNDSNSRTVVVTLWDGASPYEIPTGASAMVRFGKPDGTGGIYDAAEDGRSVTAAGNTVTAPVASQMLSVAGSVIAQVEIYTAAASGAAVSRLSSFCFVVDVEKSAYPDDAIISSDYYNVLSAAIQNALQSSADAQTAAEDAEAWALGTRNGQDVSASDPTYHNNAKYWAESVSIPTTLPNPQPLQVVIRGAQGIYDSYDGSAKKTITLGYLAFGNDVSLDNTDFGGVTGILQISNGGTGAETAAGALEKLGGLPKSGGTMVNSGDKKGIITFPGIDTAYRTGRDDAAIKVQYPSGGSADKYVPIFSGKGKTCSWEAAIYGDKVNLAQIGDTEYAAGTNTPKALYTIGADGITGIQGWQLVANGSMSQGSTLSGTADNSRYKTVHVLFGSAISVSNYYQTYDFPLPAEADFWNIYIPAQNDYFRARIDITAAGGITVTMQSDASRQCFIYVSL